MPDRWGEIIKKTGLPPIFYVKLRGIFLFYSVICGPLIFFMSRQDQLDTSDNTTHPPHFLSVGRGVLFFTQPEYSSPLALRILALKRQKKT